MTHIVAGYPDMKTSKDLLDTMIAQGVDYIEIQIPFSDPIADGPTMMQANVQSLANGTTVEDTFNLMEATCQKIKQQGSRTKMLFMTYYNILHALGVEAFCRRAASIGVYGMIIPDIPIDEEEHEKFLHFAQKYKLNALPMVSPVTTEDRLTAIAAKNKSQFVYCMSRAGTTGERDDIPEYTATYLNRIRNYFPQAKIGVGFGISTKEHIDGYLKYADTAIIGSKVVKICEKHGIAGVNKFLTDILKT